MDPQSQSFTPYSTSTAANTPDNSGAPSPWSRTEGSSSTVARLSQVQAEHGERIARLERRQDDDARLKSVWGNTSPFPSVLSGGTPLTGMFTIS